MGAQEMARGKLIGVRFSDEEFDRIQRLIAHLEEATPGASFNPQAAIKVAIALAEKHYGIAPLSPPSRPRVKASTKKR